ncbi:MAG: hypothetical protein KAW45_05235 [Thermoplasmatales archaeon]|nr:hypothetical protein [Thermoplasmatales archaeon]
MKNQKKTLRLLLLGILPIFLTILIVGLFYLSFPIYEYMKVLDQVGLWVGFYFLFLIIFGFVYAGIYGWGKDKVLTDKDHKRNLLIAFVISLILIGIFVIGLVYTNYNISADNIFGLFQMWIFFYLIPLVALEFLTWVWKVKKQSS